MDIVDYLRAFQRRWPILVVAVLVGAVLGFFTAPAHHKPALFQITAPTAYTATTYVSEGDLTGTISAGARAQLSAIAFLAGLGAVPANVATAMHYHGNPAALAAEVTVKEDPALPLLSITTTNPDGNYAAKLVNTYAQQLIAYVNNRLAAAYNAQVNGLETQDNSLQSQISQLQSHVSSSSAGQLAAQQQRALVTQYSTTYAQLQQLQETGTPTSGLITLQTAYPVPVQSAKSSSGVHVPAGRSARTAIGALLLLLIGAGIAVALDRLDTHIRTKESAESITHYPVIAEVPPFPSGTAKDKPLIVAGQPTSTGSEAFRSLRTAIALLAPAQTPRTMRERTGGAHRMGQDEPPRQVVVVTSPGPGDGKSTTVANLAASFAQAGRSVLVLSCDFLAPKVGSYLGVEGGVGVAELLAHPDRYDLDQLARPCDVPGVRIVPAGQASAAPVDLYTGAVELLDAARLMADVVIIDTAPVLLSNEATELIPWTDVMLIVVRAGRTTTGAASQTAELLGRLHAPVLGIVLNEAPPHPARSQGYYYYFQQGTEATTPAGPAPAPVGSTNGAGGSRLASQGRFRRLRPEADEAQETYPEEAPEESDAALPPQAPPSFQAPVGGRSHEPEASGGAGSERLPAPWQRQAVRPAAPLSPAGPSSPAGPLSPAEAGRPQEPSEPSPRPGFTPPNAAAPGSEPSTPHQ